MRVLVFGASGVLGRSLVPLLVSRGHQVSAAIRRPDRAALVESLGARSVAADILDAESVRAAVPGHDAIVQAASHMPLVFPGKPSDFAMNDRIRREGTAHVLAAAEAAGITRLVFQGMVWVHGDQRGAWIDEDAPFKPGPVTQSAADLEHQVKPHAARTGATITVLRSAGLYGAQAWHTREIMARLRRRLVPIIGDGDSYQCFVHVDDAAQAFALAVDSPGPGGALFLADDEPVHLAEYLRWLAHAIGAPEPLKVPRFLARLALGHEMEAAYTASLRCRNTRIKQRLGWLPRYPTFRDGYAEVLPRLSGDRGPGTGD